MSPGAHRNSRAKGSAWSNWSRSRPRDYLVDLYKSERTAVAEILRDSGADIVNAHWTYEYELAAQDSQCTHVTTAHDSPSTVLRRMPDAYRLARLVVAERAIRRTQHLSVVSPYLGSRWRTSMRYRRPIRVIPNAIPEDVAGLSRAPDPDPVILDIGNDTRLKNLRSLIRALPLVRRDLPGARLRLVGPGTDAGGDLANWASSQGLDHHVTFLGELAVGRSWRSTAEHGSWRTHRSKKLVRWLFWRLWVRASRQ